MPTTHSNLGTHGEQWGEDTWRPRGRLACDDDRKMPGKLKRSESNQTVAASQFRRPIEPGMDASIDRSID